MKPNSSANFDLDKNDDDNSDHDDKLEFSKFYNKLIKPQIDELAALMISPSSETQFNTIEDLTNSLFSNLEKLDSENMIVLNGYKVVSRSYFILNCKRQQNNNFNAENSGILKEQYQNKIIQFEKQNEEILEKMTQYLENQKNQDRTKQSIASLTKEFKQFKDEVSQVTNEIANELNLENVSDINDLGQAVIGYKNQSEKQVNLLNEEIKKLKETVSQNEKSSTSNKSVNKKNSSSKSSNEQNQSEKSNKRTKINSEPNSGFIQKDTKSNDYFVFENDQRQLLNIISQKDELIEDLKKEREKLKSFVNKKIFSNIPNNQNEFDDPIKLKTDLNLLKVKYDKVNSENSKLKAKVKKLNKLESYVEELKVQIKKNEEDQQIKMSKLVLEKDQLKTQLSDRADLNSLYSELNSKTEEIQILNETINQISNQLEEQSKEISEENRVKSMLIKIVEKQSSVLSEYEKIVIDKMKTISSQETEKLKINSILNASKEQEKNYQKQFDDIYDELMQITSKEIEDKSTSNDILFALKNRRAEDVILSYQKLANLLKTTRSKGDSSDQKYTKTEIDRLFNYVLSIVKTLRTFVNNSDADTDQKNEILRECICADSFVNENAPGLIEEPTIFDAFDIHVDESLFLEQITSFVNNFRELETNQAKELFSILTYVIVMNTILRKTAFSYRDQCEIRAFEVKKLKNRILELQQKNEDDLILNKEEEQKNEIKNTKSKSMNIKQPKEEEKQLKEQILSLKDNLEKSKKNYSMNILKYKKKIDLLTNQNNELRNKINSHKSIISQASQVSEESNSMIKSLKQEINNRDLELETSHELIQKQREEIDALKHSLLMQTEKIKQRQNETIRKEKQNSDDFIQEMKKEHQNQIRKIQQQNKMKLFKLNDDLNSEKSRYQALKSKFEDIFDDLRNQLNESRGNEMKMKLEFNQKEAEITSLKGKLSALNVDNKMLKVKYQNLEEKTNRERAFKANQNIAQQIAMEQQTTAKVNEIEISMKNKEQLFLQSLCFILRDYVNENEPVSHENIKLYLQKAMDDVKNLKNSLSETKIITNEIAKIREILQPPRTKSTSQAVQDLIDQKNDIPVTNDKNNDENDLNSNSQLLKVWNSWARRVLTLACDTTCSAKTDKELRNLIEEFIIQNSVLKNNRFMIESLRNQKKILLSKVSLKSPKKKETSILSILVVYSAIRRMQKMSGNLHSDLVISNVGDNENQQYLKKSKRNLKNYPLINSYE